MQGDTLKNILSSIQDIKKICSTVRNEELTDEVESLEDMLSGIINEYDAATS